MIAHELPSAPKFVGRENELRALQEFWRGNQSVLSLIGLGGAGKTALADRFFTWAMENDPPEKTLVWSFYDDPDTNAFLECLYKYLSGDETAEVKGSGWFHLLREQLSGSRRILIVMDGLERVQRPITDATGIYGEVEDPLLRGLLVRIATAGGNSKAVITSRFPVSTVEPYLDKGYQILNVEQLPYESAIEVLRSRGVTVSDQEGREFLERFGSHALTMDLLAGAVAAFHSGRLDALPQQLPKDFSDRLAFVLQMYEQNLTTLELDLLRRLCVFRFGVDTNTLFRIFSQGEATNISGTLATIDEASLRACLSSLVDHHLLYRESNDRFTVHPAVRDHFYRLFRDPANVHRAIADHLSSLTDRPGIGLPTDKESLDLLEELIYHAIRAEAVDKAAEVYFSRLGGNDHLNGRLGEYARCFRILQAFPTCPDPSGMCHCERAFGNLDEALAWRPQNRYILLIRGDLSELSRDAAEGTSAIAKSMQGDTGVGIPDRSPDFPIPSAMAHMFRSDLDAARRIAETELAVSIYEDDRIRNLLVLAEVYRQEQRISAAQEVLERASEWILQAASQEHLVTLHYVRGQIAADEGQVEAATFALEEGLAIAGESDFLIFQALFGLLRCRLLLLQGDTASAKTEALRVKELCEQPSLSFGYGIRESRRFLQA